MIDYIKRHEQYVLSMMEQRLSPEDLIKLLVYHDQQIAWMQHERLAHLITMLFVCLFFLLAFGYTLTWLHPASIALSLLLLVLSGAYILHYYRLENSVQRWYELAGRIRNGVDRN